MGHFQVHARPFTITAMGETPFEKILISLPLLSIRAAVGAFLLQISNPLYVAHRSMYVFVFKTYFTSLHQEICPDNPIEDYTYSKKYKTL